MKFRTLAASGLDTANFLPAAEVVSQLKLSPLPREAMAAMAALSVETLLPNSVGVLSWPYAWSPFLCLFGFTEWTGSLDTFPAWSGVSVGGNHTDAFGVWQDEPETYTEIVTQTGHATVEPQDQIANNWVLAVRDFAARGGGALLATLQAGDPASLAKISPALIATWPEGADAHFPARYTYALSLFPPAVTAPPAQPVPPPPPPASTLTVPLGFTLSYPIVGSLKNNPEPVPANALTSSAPLICSVTVSAGMAIFSGLALGSAEITGPGVGLQVGVVQPAPDNLVIDLSTGTLAPIAGSTSAAALKV